MNLAYYTEERVERLRAAFTSVANPENWKLPINAIVPVETNREEMTEAVIFFTGSVPTFSPFGPQKGMVHVAAAGYYAAIGS